MPNNASQKTLTDTRQTVTLYRSALRVTPQQSEALVAMLIAIATELCVDKKKYRPKSNEKLSDKTSHQKTAVE